MMGTFRTGAYTVLPSGEKNAIPVKSGRATLPLVVSVALSTKIEYLAILVINQRCGKAGGFHLECQRASYRYRDWNTGNQLAGSRVDGLRRHRAWCRFGYPLPANCPNKYC